MPFTPYHFGPSGFVGLVFRKYLDLPVFVLANVIVDIEVLLADSWPVHKYAHTLLGGIAVGLIWAIAAYPIRPIFRKIMNLFRLSYNSSFIKMVISGILGTWMHVIIDAIYHRDVKIFAPHNAKPLYNLLSKNNVKTACLAFFVAALILYIYILITFIKNKERNKENAES